MPRVPRTFISAVAIAALACGGLAVGGAANAAPIDPAAAAALKLAAPLRDAKPGKTVSVFIRTSGDGALAVDAKAKGNDLSRSSSPSSAAKQRLSAISTTTAAVRAAVKRADTRATDLYTTKYTIPGVAVVTDVDALTQIAKRSDVTSITPLVPKKIADPQVNASADAAPSGVDPDMVRPGADGVSPKNAASDVYVRALDAWQQTGHTGTGINVAVLDTGLDYTQADFGGPGTTAAYAQALGSTSAPDPTLYDGKKFLGGHDFAGPTYNADPTSAGYQPVPAPDDNPIDGRGGDHGTHVAGTIAGYGLNADKSTYTGDYDSLTKEQLQDMWVGPGTAPEAGLYALKVFGDGGGSTDVTGAALDWVGQALTEGKSINVLNLSLGSDYGAPDDPDNAKIDELTQRGVLPVIASGNADDFTDIGGSPGNAAGALTVAASATGQSLFDGVEATAPESVKDVYRAQYSEAGLPIEGTVAVPTTNVDGCTPFTGADADAIEGKVVWLKWTDGALECGSAVRFNNVQAAGGIGVLLAGTVDTFDSGIAGNATTPGAELTASAVTALRPAAVAGDLQVRMGDDLKGFLLATDAETVNTLASFTSRGVHGSFDDIVKPDIAGPGVNVISAANGTGDGRLSMSGTSMATPDVAGIAALTFESHPGWSATDVKAALMNTATHDVRDGNGTATPLRQGTGRVDALQAVNADTTVRSVQNGQLVTASFGVVEAAAPVSEKRTLLVRNTDDQPHTYAVTYDPRTTQSGVSWSFSTTTVTVPANGTATVTLTMSITDPTALRKDIDPTQDAVESEYEREYVAAAGGVVSFTPIGTDTEPLRITTYAAAKPVSAVHGADVSFTGTSTSSSIALSGRTVDQGSGTTGYRALVAPFVLGGTDPQESFADGTAKQSLQATDIRAFGASSTAATDGADALVSFGIQTAGPDANPGATSNLEVLIDTNRDGTPDFLTYGGKNSTVDATFATTISLTTGDVVDAQPLNGGVPGEDVNTFDSAVKVLPVSLAAIGVAKGKSFDYSIQSESFYSTDVVDETKTVTFDPYTPAMSFSSGGVSSVLFPDTGSIAVKRATATTTGSVLLLHLHNAVGDQTDVLSVSATTPKLALQSGSKVVVNGGGVLGRTLTVSTGTWNVAKPTFTYQWTRDGKAISGATKSTYKTVNADLGTKIRVVVTAKATGYENGTATSAGVGPIRK